MSDSPPTAQVLAKPLRLFAVNWRTLSYPVLLLFASFFLFGPTGFFVCVIVLVAWAYVFLCDAKLIALGIVGMLGLSVYLCLACLLARADPQYERYVHAECKNNLKQIMLAMQNYHDDYGSLPPAFVADENGKPMHSWRVLLLPYIGRQDVYDIYRFDEPWNSANNLKLLNTYPDTYSCSASHAWDSPTNPHRANYVVVVDPNTCWPGSKGRPFDEITDGTSQTVAVIETTGSNIPWTEPRDIDLDTAVELLSASNQSMSGIHEHNSFFYEFASYRHMATADGAVHSAQYELSKAAARNLLVMNDGKSNADRAVALNAFQPDKRLRTYNTVCFVLFVLLVVLPLPWVWLKPRSWQRDPDRTLVVDSVAIESVG